MVQEKSSNFNIDENSFYLSKPFKINFNSSINENFLYMTKTNNNNTQKLNNLQQDFLFVQPIESKRIAFKQKTFLNNLDTQQTQTSSSSISIKKDSFKAEKPTNASLARFSSISSTFKSMFVRPRHRKLINISIFKKKENNQELDSLDSTLIPTNGENLKLNQSVNDYLLNLCGSGGAKSSASSSIADTSSVHHQDDYLSETIKKISNNLDNLKRGGNSVNQTRYSNLNESYALTRQQQYQNLDKTNLINTKWTCLLCLSKNLNNLIICSICGTSKASSSLTQHNTSLLTSSSKAMSSCSSNGSSNMTINDQRSLTYQLNNFAKQSLVKSRLLPSGSSLNDEQEVLIKNKINKKMWTCQYCNYANDSLKIVCMNCRSCKSSQMSSVEGIKLNLKENLMKRKAIVALEEIAQQQSSFSGASSCCSNENGETSAAKRHKLASGSVQSSAAVVCSKCHHKIDEKEVEEQTSVKQQESSLTNLNLIQSKTNNLLDSMITPTKPANIFDTNKPAPLPQLKPIEEVKKIEQQPLQPSPPQPLSTVTTPSLKELFKNNKKWNCDVCLASNDENKTECACCLTPKGGNSGGGDKTTAPATATASSSQQLESNLNSFFANANKSLFSSSTTSTTTSGSSDLGSKFSFGTPANTESTGGITFGTPSTNKLSFLGSTAPNSGFSFPLATTTSTPATTTSTTSSFSLIKPSETPTSITSTFSLPGLSKTTFPQVATAAATTATLPSTTSSFSFNSQPNNAPSSIFKSAPVSTAFSSFNAPSNGLFGASSSQPVVAVTPATTSAPSFTFGSTVAATNPPPPFGFGSTSNTSTSPFSFGNSTTTPSATTTSTTSTATTTPSFTFGSAPAVKQENSIFGNLSSKSSSSLPSPFSSSIFGGNTAASTATASTTPTVVPSNSFSLFSNQAAPVSSTTAPFTFGNSDNTKTTPINTSSNIFNPSAFSSSPFQNNQNTTSNVAKPFVFGGGANTNIFSNSPFTSSSSNDNLDRPNAKRPNQETPATPSFSMNLTPNFNFATSSTTENNTFGAALGQAPFIFSANPQESSTQSQSTPRAIKKPVRKLKK